MHPCRLFLPVLFIAACLPTLASAQTATQAQPPSASEIAGSARKRIEIVRTTLAPEIDGILDDEIWKTAAVLTDMHQFLPVDHGEPTERSVFYLAYTDRFLYIGARLYDSNPAGIGARQLMQGQGFAFDDAFEIILDTFNNGRTGYYFQANPNGIRAQGVYDDPNTLNRDWAGIWHVESRIDDEGWTAEVVIPFNTLNFDPDTTDWGFTIGRTISRKQEELGWSSFNRTLNPTTTGILSGFTGLRQGVGLDIIPSLAMATGRNHLLSTRNERVDPSLNVFYKFTPNLTGALTLNTDFSATEVDNRQVNLTRFSLFFPEKRDFFLQDVDIFNFGGRGSQTGGPPGSTQNGIPFYSRRVGLSSAGQPIDIDGGVKLTGRVGEWNVGALAVQQGDTATLDGQGVFVGRVARNVLAESSVGAILTHGDPTSDIGNTLAGVDFRYQNTRFTDSHTLRGDFWYQQSDTEGRTGDQKAWGARANLSTQSNGIGATLGYSHFGEDYRPALGFANQVGIENFILAGNARYFLPDNSLIRFFNWFGHITRNNRLDTGEMQTESTFIRLINVNTHMADEAGASWYRDREGLDRPFEISPGIIIPAGVYTFSGLSMNLNGSAQRLFSPSLQVSAGEFFSGDRLRYQPSMQWRPNEHFLFSVNYDYQDIQLPEGDFKVKLIGANLNYAFNNKWSWVNLIQYDNASSSVGINSRLRWNPQAGEDLFLVINYNFAAEGVFSRLNPALSEIALKYTKTFRY
jgi:hypothetical protein